MLKLLLGLVVAVGVVGCGDTTRPLGENPPPPGDETPDTPPEQSQDVGQIRAINATKVPVAVCLHGTSDVWLATSLAAGDFTDFTEAPVGTYELRVVAEGSSTCDDATFTQPDVLVAKDAHLSVVVLGGEAVIPSAAPEQLTLVNALDTTLALDLFFVDAANELFTEVTPAQVASRAFEAVTNQTLRVQLASAADGPTTRLVQGINFPGFTLTEGTAILLGETGTDMSAPAARLLVCPNTAACVMLDASPRVFARKPREYSDIELCFSAPGFAGSLGMGNTVFEPGTYTLHSVPAYKGCDEPSAPGTTDRDIIIEGDAPLQSFVVSPAGAIDVVKTQLGDAPFLYSATGRAVRAHTLFGESAADLGYLDAMPVDKAWLRVAPQGNPVLWEDYDLTYFPEYVAGETMQGYTMFYNYSPDDNLTWVSVCDQVAKADGGCVEFHAETRPTRSRSLNAYNNPPRAVRFCHATRSAGVPDRLYLISNPVPTGAATDYVMTRPGIYAYVFAAEVDDLLCANPLGSVVEPFDPIATTIVWTETNTTVATGNSGLEDFHPATQLQLVNATTSQLSFEYGSEVRVLSGLTAQAMPVAAGSGGTLALIDITNGTANSFALGPFTATDIVSLYALTPQQLTVCINNQAPSAGLSACTVIAAN